MPDHQQKQAIFWGTAGAIAIRAIATLLVVWLLELSTLMLVGGILLLWIAYNLLTDKKDHTEIDAPPSMAAAVRTIVIADGVMGIDNVMGVAGIAHGNMSLVIVGLLVTVPIIMWGSTLFIKLVENYPAIIYFGGGILAWTAATMITDDPLVNGFFATNYELKLILNIGLVVAILAAAAKRKRKITWEK